jgi:cytoskeleton protein RodZ
MTENTQADSPPLASTAGGLLKAARQAKGMHLAVLSVNLKVSVRQLEALEADEYLLDQSPVFARGLAASVCRQLSVDPAPILALMPMSANYLESNGVVRQAFKATADLGRLRTTKPVASIKTLVVSLGMVLLIAVLIWWPNLSQWVGFETLRAALSVSEPVAPSAAPVALGESSALEAVGPGLAASAPAASAVNAAMPLMSPAAASEAASATGFPKGQAPELKPQTQANTDRLELKP